MTSTICLDEKYSTTRLILNDECLMVNENQDNSKLANAVSQSEKFPRKFKIQNSSLFLPEGENRKGGVV